MSPAPQVLVALDQLDEPVDEDAHFLAQVGARAVLVHNVGEHLSFGRDIMKDWTDANVRELQRR